MNVLAAKVDQAKQGEIEFEKAIAQDNDCNLSIDSQNVSDDEFKSVVGNDLFTRVYMCYSGIPALDYWCGWAGSIKYPKYKKEK